MRNRQVGSSESAQILADVVPKITYKPGWTFELKEVSRGQGCEGLTLLIGATVPDSFGDGMVSVLHLMPVLPAAYDEHSWIQWILEQIQLVEQHEMLEFFEVSGHKVFFPGHAPGRNPYGVSIVMEQDDYGRIVTHGADYYGMSRMIHGLPVTQERAHQAAVPWFGGDPKDPHFHEEACD